MASQNSVLFGLTAVAAAFLIITVFLQAGVSAGVAEQGARIASLENTLMPASDSGSGAGTGSFLDNLIPSGIPEIYGAEMGVSFDRPVESLAVLKEYDPDYGSRGIALEGSLLQRYINVGMQISCEYCCSAKSIVFSDGGAACGCAHSQAMRGLAAYLLENHANEYTDDQVLEELTKWKTMFFPKQTIAKAVALAEQSGSTDIDPKLLNEIPDMVGGC